MTALIAGWAVPDNERMSHFFVDGRSLCRLWLSTGTTTPNPRPGGSHCRTCAERAPR